MFIGLGAWMEGSVLWVDLDPGFSFSAVYTHPPPLVAPVPDCPIGSSFFTAGAGWCCLRGPRRSEQCPGLHGKPRNLVLAVGGQPPPPSSGGWAGWGTRLSRISGGAALKYTFFFCTEGIFLWAVLRLVGVTSRGGSPPARPSCTARPVLAELLPE